MYIHLTKELLKYIKQKLTQPRRETEKSMIIFGEVNTPFLIMEGTDNQ